MNKITKDHAKQLAELRERWTKAREALVAEIDDVNATIVEANSKLSGHVADMNEIITDANALREEIESDAQNYHDEKSERWQEGEKGSAYSEWISAWGNEIDELEPVEVAEIDADDLTLPETLLDEEEYPEAPNE